MHSSPIFDVIVLGGLVLAGGAAGWAIHSLMMRFPTTRRVIRAEPSPARTEALKEALREATTETALARQKVDAVASRIDRLVVHHHG